MDELNIDEMNQTEDNYVLSSDAKGILSHIHAEKVRLVNVLAAIDDEKQNRHLKRLACTLQTILEQIEYHLDEVKP